MKNSLFLWKGRSPMAPFEVWHALMHEAPDLPGDFEVTSISELRTALAPAYGDRLREDVVDSGGEGLVCTDGWELWLADEAGKIVWVRFVGDVDIDAPAPAALRAAALKAGFCVFATEPERFFEAQPEN